MGFADDLKSEVADIFAPEFETRDGQKVPDPEDVALGNEAVRLDGAVLYADLAQSTPLVDGYKWWFAAKVYKAYLHCASKMIRHEGGEITAFDGDRVMAVFIGDDKETAATRCALRIKWIVDEVVNPAIVAKYPKVDYKVQQAVGVDVSGLYAARTGIRGSNDLVWVGRAANYAAKLCSLRDGPYASWITDSVYNKLAAAVRVTDGKEMWEARTWTEKKMTVYRSSWRWGL